MQFHRHHQRGFTLVEVLLSLSITLIIVTSVVPLYRLCQHSFHLSTYDEDIYIAAKQVSQYLLGSYYIDSNEGYHYLTYDQKEMNLIFDRQRLVKKDGYEIIVSHINEVSFDIKNSMVYMNIKRGKKDYSFLVGYAREKTVDENNEKTIE